MPNLLVRNLDERLVARLKTQAKQRGRSLQAEIHAALHEHARLDPAAFRAVADYWQQRLAGRRQSDSTKLIREDRDRR
jgi:antitoxin FitA